MLPKNITVGTFCLMCDCQSSAIGIITEISETRKSFWFCLLSKAAKSTPQTAKNLKLAEKKEKWIQARYTNKRQIWLCGNKQTGIKRVLPGVAKQCPYTQNLT